VVARKAGMEARHCQVRDVKPIKPVMSQAALFDLD
jgi:hypothetical protein